MQSSWMYERYASSTRKLLALARIRTPSPTLKMRGWSTTTFGPPMPIPEESWYTFHVVSIGNVPVIRPPSQQLSAFASKYTGYGMAALGAHVAASAFTRSLGFNVAVNRAVCAPVMVRVGDAEQAPAAPPVAGAASSGPDVTTRAAIAASATRLFTLPPDPCGGTLWA